MRLNASNTFKEGLMMDMNPLSISNDILTNCLNGTLISYNGNELVLQNDVGNSKINLTDSEGNIKETIQLKEGAIPVGLLSFGGILYICSVYPKQEPSSDSEDTSVDTLMSVANDDDEETTIPTYLYSEIGTFPSPNYDEYVEGTNDTLEYVYRPLHNLVINSELTDFSTKFLNFLLTNPVQIECLKDYDATVNLILNDGINKPRLINTRFSCYGENQYKIVDREGTADSNKYSGSSLDEFNIQTALNKIVNSIVKITFKGELPGGNLYVGNYVFYFTLADADDNETDFIGESSIVTCHKGNLLDPMSIDGGILNENSYKIVLFNLSNIPSAYSKVYVYYSRNSSDLSGNAVTTYFKLNTAFEIPDNIVNNRKLIDLNITGFESTTSINEETINPSYNIIDAAKTQAISLNILFLGNITQNKYKSFEDLKRIALNIYPTLHLRNIGKVNDDYDITIPSNATEDDIKHKGEYYNIYNIYDRVGYWPDELYRFGIVYILSDYTLSPVFNVRGINDIKTYYDIDDEERGVEVDPGAAITAEDYDTFISTYTKKYDGDINIYGICKFNVDPELMTLDSQSSTSTNLTKAMGVKFNFISEEDVRYLKKTLNVKGYFFVRQKRLKTTLCLAVLIAYDRNYSNLPLLKGTLADSDLIIKYNTGVVGTATYLLTEKYVKGDPNYFLSINLVILDRLDPGNETDDPMIYTYYDETIVTTDIDNKTIKYLDLLEKYNSVGNHSYTEFPFLSGQATEESSTTYIGWESGPASTTSKSNIYNSYLSDLYFTETFLNYIDKSNKIDYSFAREEALNTFSTDPDGIKYFIFNTVTSGNNGMDLILDESYITRALTLRYPQDAITAFLEKSTDTIKTYEPTLASVICPEYETNQAYYNLLFTASKYQVRFKYTLDIETLNLKLFSTCNPKISYNTSYYNVYLQSVPEDTPAVRNKENIYSSRAGNASDPTKYSVPFTNILSIDVGTNRSAPDGENVNIKNRLLTPVVRGIWGPYVGIEDADAGNDVINDTDTFKNKTSMYSIMDIKIPEYNNTTLSDLISVRADDKTSYYAISDRIDISSYNDVNSNLTFRGDCFICNFTHRMNRNFLDPEFPLAEDIADTYGWEKLMRYKFSTDNDSDILVTLGSNSYKIGCIFKADGVLYYDKNSKTDAKISYLNRSDVNAVPLGHWLTTKVYSSTNLSIRSTDGSNITEKATVHHDRSFYPLQKIDLSSSTKIADSYIMNGGYAKTVSERYNIRLEEVPALKENFFNRIIYSNIAIKDGYKNNFRVFESGDFLDYTRKYGSITKILTYGSNDNLFVVFEHAIAAMAVNEKAIATNSESGLSYIKTNKVITDTPLFVSEQYGSLWQDSIIKTPTGIYGVDTVAKKIWWYGDGFLCISDFKIGKFLKDNLTITELEDYVNLGRINVHTHYNARKQDILFTFFKTTYKDSKPDDEIAWNICYNEITKKFTTFYSWLPSYSGNINNTFYSFDNEVSRNNYEALSDDSLSLQNNYLWQHNKENNWCHWYDEQHPFEFEFVVAENPQYHKIFNDLLILANKTKPESFHFEIVGEVYNFADDKSNMYYRQEETKQFLRDIYAGVKGYDLSYDENYEDTPLNKLNKSTIFPLYVSRVDKSNKIYDSYQRMTSSSKDYQSYSGSEIAYDNTIDEYTIKTHAKAYAMDDYEKVYIGKLGDEGIDNLITYYLNHNVKILKEVVGSDTYVYKIIPYGRRLGNCLYQEDKWLVQIPSINYAEKNESSWYPVKDDNGTVIKYIPYINLFYSPIPEEVTVKESSLDKVLLDKWKNNKLTRLRDKYIKIKVRYTGNDLAIITAIITAYNISFA